MKDTVIITKLSSGDYSKDYVALPADYGTGCYFKREDIRQIYQAVYENLNLLDHKIHFTDRLPMYKHVIIKPNLVSVFHKAGMKEQDFPESTDPRVFDAVVAYIKQYTDNIIIAESSGKPMPTATSFRVSGIDRIARYYGTGLIALETSPVVRYMLPKAEVMKEVYLPEILAEVIEGDSFYISVPKLKTNIYTKVTLGFKNAMGMIPYFLRERNHNYYINKKLADLLYVLKPNLVVIDGVIGGEGNTPAPVDPVPVGVILSGNNTVEVDKAACRIMDIDPESVPLMREAEVRGFGSSEAEIVGECEPVSFRRANASLMDEEFHRAFPHILALAGHSLPHAPKVEHMEQVTPEIARRLELACDGGCLCALRSGFDYVVYSQNPKYDFPLVVIIGSGIPLDGKRYWFDRDGKAYEEKEIRALKQPKLTLGNCAKHMEDCAQYTTSGCCSPSTCMLAATAAAGITFPLLSVRNTAVGHLGIHVLLVVLKRCKHILLGKWVDCPSEHVDKIYPIPELDEQELQKDYIPWPLPNMKWPMKWKLIKNQFLIMKMK